MADFFSKSEKNYSGEFRVPESSSPNRKNGMTEGR